MKSVRLLPVVIFAALALLVFKGVGLLTNGGYVLTGPVAVMAEEHGGENADAGATMPSEAIAADTAPTMGDTAPTLPAKLEAPPGPSSSGHEASSASMEGSASSTPAGSSSAQTSSQSSEAKPDLCPETGASSAPAAADGLNERIGNALASPCLPAVVPTNANGDVLPTIKDGNGKIVPLAATEGDSSEAALLQRLSERRAALDKREADIDLRTSLVAAAEQRLDERTKALQDLEAKVTALVDEKQAAEDAGFKAIVTMYETMKAKDAAKIFDTLDPAVLLKVARAMNPRQMSPILALMSPDAAQALTTAFATSDTMATVGEGSENLAKLPQIVGH